VASVALVTAVIFALREVVPVVSTGVVYMLAVLFVSSFWGLWLGLLSAFLSAAAFNFFHIPPTGRFTIADGENWVALAVFFVPPRPRAVTASRPPTWPGWWKPRWVRFWWRPGAKNDPERDLPLDE